MTEDQSLDQLRNLMARCAMRLVNACPHESPEVHTLRAEMLSVAEDLLTFAGGISAADARNLIAAVARETDPNKASIEAADRGDVVPHASVIKKLRERLMKGHR